MPRARWTALALLSWRGLQAAVVAGGWSGALALMVCVMPGYPGS